MPAHHLTHIVEAYGSYVLISANFVRSAAYAVRCVLAERNSKLALDYAGYLIAAQRDIERRLGVAMRHESVAITELRQRAQLQLADCVANHALALLGARHREIALRRQAAHRGITTLIEWAQQRNDPTQSMLALFEQWIINGHPLHPAAKVRLGMSPVEVLATCPEWGNTVELRVVALHHTAAQEYGSAITRSPAQQRPLTNLLLREHPQLRAAVVAECGAQQSFQDSVTLLPVHPWQADHVLPGRFGRELNDGTLRFLPVHIPARPLVSYRTVIPLATPTAPHPSHLKTALSVQLTNALRGVSPSAAHNGPQVSRLLEEILRREHHFGGRLEVLAEPAAAHFQSAEPQTATNAQALQRASSELAALARSNPELDLGEGELLLPAGAFTARSPLSNQPVLAELLDTLCAANPNAVVLSNRADAARYFTYCYANVCVPPLLTLLTRYGVALEAHGENMLLVIRAGEPQRCVVRDFGGVRIHSQRLAEQQLHIQLLAGSVIATSDDHELRHKLYFALFVNELSQLITCLSRLSGLSIARLWQPFRAAATRTFDELAAEPRTRRAAQEDARALLEQPWPYKAMLSMWLRGDVTDYSYLPTHNPFAVTSRGNA